MDWAALAAGVIVAIGSVFAYLSKRMDAKQLTATVEKQILRIAKLEDVNIRKTKYVRQLEKELVKRTAPGEHLDLLNSLFAPTGGGDSGSVPPGTTSKPA